MEQESNLEMGIGPINFGTAQVERCNGLDEISQFEKVFIKVERAIFATIFLGMFILTVYNCYKYLYKRHMYSSYPLVFNYVCLFLFALMGVFYEMYMGFRCGNNDCFAHLLISVMPEYSVYFFSEEHKSYLVEVSIMWKLRQQLLWGLGIGQILIIAALSMKIRHVEGYFDSQINTTELRKRITQAD